MGKPLFWHYYLQLSFVYKYMSQISCKLFRSGHKRLLTEFLRKWGWFQGHNERFHKYFGEKLKFQKTETGFCRWKSTNINDINIFLSVENPCTFLLAKEKIWKGIFNTNSELSQNRTEKQIILFKTTVNCLFNDTMMLFSHWLFWLKNCRFKTNSCMEGFIVSIKNLSVVGQFLESSNSRRCDWILKLLAAT